MSTITSIDHAITPKSRPAFQIDWEITYFCNLDCSYCGSHDNSTKHPDIDRCRKGIEFAFAYADIIMQSKKSYERAVSLNLLGGETLIHPEIVDILEYMRELYETKYKNRWRLTTNITTNGVVGTNVLERCLPLLDYWVISYHTESLPKQKKLAIDTIYTVKKSGKPCSVRLMMHKGPTNFAECQDLAKQLDQDGISYALKPIGATQNIHDNWDGKGVHSYTKDQTTHLMQYWARPNNTSGNNITTPSSNDVKMLEVDNRFVVATAGYPCCSEKPLCVNQDRKNPVIKIPMTGFKDWYCSVNWYFLFVKQSTEEVFHNKSCTAKLDGTLGPIGMLDQADKILSTLQKQIDNKAMPVMRCPKLVCGCGMCAPKAEQQEVFDQIMSAHIDNTVLLY